MNVYSLHDIGVVLETAHVKDVQKIDLYSSPPEPIPAVKTVANDTLAKPTQENFSTSHAAAKKFACTYCWRKFNHKYFLDTHVRTHTGEKPFSCHYCDYSSARKRDLKRHYRTHAVQKSHKCDFCDKVFTRESDLNRHIHTHTKPFGCDVCGKMFAYSGARNNHFERC